MIRVLVVEDQRDTRERIVRTLRQHAAELTVEAASSAEAALDLVSRSAFDCALIDLGLPGMTGLELVATLVDERPATVPIVLTTFDDEPTVFAALRAGARGYLLKNVQAMSLYAAIREATRGGAPMTPRIARIVLDAWKNSAEPARAARSSAPGGAVATLSERERSVLAELARGRTYAEVGAALGIGLGTVQGYVKTIYGKLRISSKAEAAALATKLGLTGP